MRNVDKINGLERELGRYRKKVEDQTKENEKLRKVISDALSGNLELQRGLDAILAQTAITYGEDAADPDTGEIIGWRLSLPLFSVSEILKCYEVRARKDEKTGAYIVGVVEREHE